MKKMKILRFILGMMLPPVFGSLILLFITGVKEDMGLIDIVPAFLFYVAFAFPIMLLPSIVYSAVMEGVGAKIKERKVVFLLLSTLMGLGAGLYRFGSHQSEFMLVGTLTGISVGLVLLKLHSIEKSLYTWEEIEPDGTGQPM